MEKELKIYQTDSTYNLGMNLKQAEQEELLEIIITAEDDPEEVYSFVGGLTKLIDQDKFWKKFEVSEIIDLINYNYEQKKLELQFQNNSAIISLVVSLFNKETKTSLKLNKTEKKELTKDEMIETLNNKVSKLSVDILKIKRKKTEHVCQVSKNSQFYLTYPNKIYEFETTFKYNGDVEFIYEMEIHQNAGNASWLCVSILWENIDRKEKDEFIIYNKNFYATCQTSSGWYNHPTIKSQRIVNFKSGNYKMKLIIEQNSSGNIFYASFIKLFSKSKN